MRGSSVEVSGRETDGGSGVPIERRRGRYPIGRGSMQVNGDACGSKPSRGLAGRIEVQRARGFGCGDRVYRAADRGGDPGGAVVAEVDRVWTNTEHSRRGEAGPGVAAMGEFKDTRLRSLVCQGRPGGARSCVTRIKRWTMDDG